MGLDITAYRGVQLLETVEDAEAWEDNYYMVDGKPETTYFYHEYLTDNPFADRAEGLTPGGVYTYQNKFDFGAGSYSGYNLWREQLCEAVFGFKPEIIWKNPTPFINAPFYYLINFSDCDGIINSELSARLAKDFADWQKTADAHSDEWFRTKYADWRKAAEIAADNGFIKFH